VVIVGFPNVGKSTLFNSLLKRKKSLVHSLPGMTRDCVSSTWNVSGKKCILVDTGGFFGVKEEPLSEKVREKAWGAARDADIILFVLDGRRNLLPAEEDLFISLKKLDKPVLAVINKVDTPKQEEDLAEFYRLGAERLIPVSAEHKINLAKLEEDISALLPERPEEKEEARPLRVAIIGRINVGKSSLINKLCGREKLIVSEMPGTTRDSVDTLIRRNQKAYLLIDTAGIRKLGAARDTREKAGIIRAKRNIREADVICLVLDAAEFPTRQDTAVARLALDSGKPLLVALNKWDLIGSEEKNSEAFRLKFLTKLEFLDYAPLLMVSALTGQRVAKILDVAEEVWRSALRRVETPRLNKFLTATSEAHPPRAKDGGRINIKYMVQTGVCPPTFHLFTHSASLLFPSYEKFFIKSLRGQFDFWGTPIRIVLRRN
jgi:GTP-binding protein